ncbi:hypothetical protein [Kocuria arenosa]|uniref:hypothetical protein n=1 Tax=Kocuria arenosa TaxID=3071446 RepID=UPI0034D7227E
MVFTVMVARARREREITREVITNSVPLVLAWFFDRQIKGIFRDDNDDAARS